jgi:hypothetical protein
MNNPLILFLQELFLRFSAKSPVFFKVWQVITGIPVLIIALPEALRIMHIDLPQVFSQHIQTIVSYAASGMFIMSLMTTQGKTVAVDQNGAPIKQSNADKLPFTTKVETKAVIKDIADDKTPPVEVIQLENPVVPKSN